MKARQFILAGLFLAALAAAGCGAKGPGPPAASRHADGASRKSARHDGAAFDRSIGPGAGGREELAAESGDSPRMAALPKESGAGWIPPSALPPPTAFASDEPATPAAEPAEVAGESAAQDAPPDTQVPLAPSNSSPEVALPPEAPRSVEQIPSGGNPLRSAAPRLRPATSLNPLRLGSSSFAPGLATPRTTRNPPRIPSSPPATTLEDDARGPPIPPETAAPESGAEETRPEASPPPESATPEAAPPEAAPPEAAPPEAAPPPDAAPPDAAPPEAAPPAEISPDPEPQEENAGEAAAPAEESPSGAMALMGSGDDSERSSAATPGPSLTPHDDGPFTVVKVFYGTDRLAVAAGAPLTGLRFITWFPLLLSATLAVALALAVAAIVYRWSRRAWLGVVAAVAVVAVCVAMGRPLSSSGGSSAASDASPLAYSNGRGELQYGECEVTIPKLHEVGEIERPSVWRLEVQERLDRHIILRSVERRGEQAFYDAVKQRVSDSPRKDLFVFIHGYNVSFETAARRTAQMAHDLSFQGAPIFYSWPSQGGLLQYPIDENNVAWTVPHLKQFLRGVVARSDAQAINIIAHSMGNRALAAAVQELTLENRPTAKQFNEVVLAAPDIDAEVFKRDVAPLLIQSAKRITLYASSRDQALVASKLVHGYPRAGDSGSNLVVLPGVETVDVTEVDTGILGHSYYGNSVPILRDLEQLFCASTSAARRPWLEQAERDGQKYWVFDEHATAARFPGSRR